MAPVSWLFFVTFVVAPCLSAPTEQEGTSDKQLVWHEQHWQSGPVAVPVANGGRRPVVVPVVVNTQTGWYNGRPTSDHDEDDDDVTTNDCYWNGRRRGDSRCLSWSTYGLKWFFDDDSDYSDRKFFKMFGWPRHHSHDIHHERRRDRDLDGKENYNHPHWDHHAKAEIVRRRKDHH
ncbi:uncharacterized protein LOC129580896 [Paramacrobiotus metropolitanus]|uniref:uncharacterized protein LOC129580896 n=1 Tax=Paramacrobiotus metropolitanus TaxID=2943436 RepID=UPI0024458E77|nr:uncharacterized protein LOC129580896 [Paramacrobiotus metropolitanus]